MMDKKLKPPILVGEKVLWLSCPKSQHPKGVVKWIGIIPELSSDWSVGVELDRPFPEGGSNGYWEDRKLFECKPQHGVIIPAESVQKIVKVSSVKQDDSKNHSEDKLDVSQLSNDLNLYNNTKESTSEKRESNLNLKIQSVHGIKTDAGKAVLEKTQRESNEKLSKVRSRTIKSNLDQNKNSKVLNYSEAKSLLRKRRRRKSSRDRLPKISSPTQINYDDFQLVRKSLDKYSYFTINEAFEFPINSKSIGTNFDKNMNEGVGHFKEIKENEFMNSRHEKPRNECEKQLNDLMSFNLQDSNMSGYPKEKKFFSFLKWFKKNKQNPDLKKAKDSSVSSSPIFGKKRDSSSESLDSLFSTQTVRSFAYIPPTLYQPSAPPYSLVDVNTSFSDEKKSKKATDDKDFVAEKKKKRRAPGPPRLIRESSLPTTLEHKKSKEDFDNDLKTYHRRTVSESFKDKKAGAYCHVQGKRKAPLPPVNSSIYPNLEKLNAQYSSLHKKKKPAPPPPQEPRNNSNNSNLQNRLSKDVSKHEDNQNATTPDKNENLDLTEENEKFRDFKLLCQEKPDNQKLLQTRTNIASVSPLPSRPWYKRNLKESSGNNLLIKDLLKGFDKKKNKDTEEWMPEVGFSRRSSTTDTSHNKFNIFSRLDKADEKKKDEKRKSQISILTNISELDKEAAEILRKEQADEKKMKAENDAKYYSPQPQQKLYNNKNNDDENENIDIVEENTKLKNVTKVSPNMKSIAQKNCSAQSKSTILEMADDSKCNNLLTVEGSSPDSTEGTKQKENEDIIFSNENISKSKNDNNKFFPNKENTDSFDEISSEKLIKPKVPTDLGFFNVQDKEVSYLNKPWVCSKCTLENPGWRIFCEICGSVKPRFFINSDDKNKTGNNVIEATSNSGKDKVTEQISNARPKKFSLNTSSELEKTEPSANKLNREKEESVEEMKKRRTEFFSSKLDNSHAVKEKETKDKISAIKPVKKENECQTQIDVLNNQTGNTEQEIKPTQTKIDDVRNCSSSNQVPTQISRKQLKIQPTTSKDGAEKVVEAYVITKTTVLEDVIIKKADKPSKVTTSVQTNIVGSPSKDKRTDHKITIPSVNKASKPSEDKINSPTNHEISSTQEEEKFISDLEKLTMKLTKAEGLADFCATLKSMEGTKMNSAAVNQLVKNLGKAINEGNHSVAATLAKELALLNTNSNVTQQPKQSSPSTSKITVGMYVEDQVSQKGPIHLEVSPTMTVLQLKQKVQRELGIPTDVQRWILGKKLATDDNKTLELNDIKHDFCPVFLYLVTPEKKEKTPSREVQNKHHSHSEALAESTNLNLINRKGKGWYYNYEEDHYSYCEDSEEESANSNSEKRDGVIKTTTSTPGTSSNGNVMNVPTTSKTVEDNHKLQKNSIFNLKSRDGESEIEKELKLISANSVKHKVEQLNRTFAENNANTTFNYKYSNDWKCVSCSHVNSSKTLTCITCGNKKVHNRIKAKAPKPIHQPFTKSLQVDKGTAPATSSTSVHYNELIELQDSDLVLNTEPFTCSICIVDYSPGEGITLKDCLHTFCRNCLISTVRYSEDAEVKCPYLDDVYSCKSVLQQREIKALVPKGMFEVHLAKSVKEAESQMENAFHCKTPDCKGWCIYEDNVNEFHCPVCKFKNCLTCQAIHTGMNCRDYQEKAKNASETDVDAKKTREMLQEMIEKGEAMACPKCQVVLMKKWGCDWLRCSMCKTEVCWITRGFRWGPGGTGDTSGGCKCGVKGIKCHPKCNYCH